MNVAICIDSLLVRDDSIFLLEMVLNLFPNSEIYTITHKQGSILGQIETRPIVSSFLTHRAKSLSEFKKNFWLIPSAVKAIPLHKSIDKVIVISRGYIHGLNLPIHVQRYLYLVDWSMIDQEHLGWQRLFAPYVNNWREKGLQNYFKIATSSESLKKQLFLPNAQVIPPTFRTEEYPFVKDEDHNFLFTHHLVYTHDLTLKEFRAIAKVLLEKGETVRVLGPDQHLTSVKKEFLQIEFAGDHCEATSALYSHQAKVIWDLSRSYFPSKAMGALCTGRPTIVRDEQNQREFLTQGTYFLSSFDESKLVSLHGTIEASYLTHDRRSLRRLGLKWNERLFKSRMVKFLDKNE
jgi:hypothetical protein